MTDAKTVRLHLCLARLLELTLPLAGPRLGPQARMRGPHLGLLLPHRRSHSLLPRPLHCLPLLPRRQGSARPDLGDPRSRHSAARRVPEDAARSGEGGGAEVEGLLERREDDWRPLAALAGECSLSQRWRDRADPHSAHRTRLSTPTRPSTIVSLPSHLFSLCS